MDSQEIPSNPEEDKESQPMEVDSSTEPAAESEVATPANDEAAAAETATDSDANPEIKEEAGEVAKGSTTEEALAIPSEEAKDVSTEESAESKISSPVKNEEESAEEGEIPSEDEPSGVTDDDKPKVEPTTPKEDEAAVASSESKDKGDSKPPEPAVKEEDAVSMDVDSSDANDPEPAKPTAEAPAAASTTTTYSTRGRSTEAAAIEEKPERIHIRDSFEESPRPKDPSASVSFLVEVMTEEERRTRTRFLPEVDGMTMLRKSEIKDDLALANSLPAVVSSAGLETRTKRLGGTRNNDAMDVDGAEAKLTVVDENATTIKLPTSTLTTPCDAFVAPKGVLVGDTANSIDVKEFEPAVQSPSKVESVMSFNPPRPPESVGGKKTHRMLRWERRPEDIEVDMKNYRRTVQRTRQELQKSESQYERLEMIDSHLRHHFLNHLDLLDKEHNGLQDQLEVEVEKLIQESDLVGSRTRSRNLSKVDVVMRDVLTMLTRNEQKDIAMDGVTKDVAATTSECAPGIGGLNTQAFIDWERSTQLESMSPCVSWVEPGQKVTTPYGEGVVTKVIPPESPPSNESLAANHAKKVEEKKSKKEMTEEQLRDLLEKEKYEALLPLRVEVKLDYGTGVFDASAIKTMESPAHFTDAQLAKRWKGMIESALKVGPCIDLQGMIPDIGKNGAGKPSNEEKEASSTDSTSSDEFLTVGSTLIPTKFGRGNFLHDMEIPDIEDTLESVLYEGRGVLGRKSNPGVSNEFRKWEDDEQEYLNLQASVLQLKNKLYRQRRIGILNKRTTNSMNDRYLRAEELVSEMRTDLKSLKRRLGDELKELGITDSMANQIIFKFYQGHQEEDKGDALTPKRLRRASSMIEGMLDIDVGSDRREGDSMDDQGTDDLSGDDLETRRPAKKIRSGE
eukprot:CAMPEP_0116146644 /NCGR_PEP_ID=MMETSP0329-20121206/17281_1 /TAXON_ID=697910 /ORGANISM="Pseudo-nitzschia arenysensis, Strain B593" /LENGTH=905 /DNA_ID=CAMNT_0003642419 /DNA_START=149 /DNA_END=2866 /DNA_ORIENTATION=+